MSVEIIQARAALRLVHEVLLTFKYDPSSAWGQWNLLPETFIH